MTSSWHDDNAGPDAGTHFTFPLPPKYLEVA